MPQMAPMMWTTLMIMFIMAMIVMNMMIYFNKEYQMSYNKKQTKTMMKNWKW